MLINLGLFLAIWITSSFAEQSSSGDAVSAKTMVFQDMLGKKDPPSPERDELFKKTLMVSQDVRDKKNSIAPDIDDNILDNFDKRAPMGFQGMRGKKEYFIPDISEDFYFRDDYGRRRPMGFQSMRGKKTVLEDEHYKRALMGFQGMRGKKSLEEILSEIEKGDIMREKKAYIFEYPQYYDKRILAMGFQGMRGKKRDLPAQLNKRDPMGFQGMRGKKTFLDDTQEHAKRAIMGFQGTRGKKDVIENYMDDYVDFVDFDKRAPMGFQGMRGKRNTGQKLGVNNEAFETQLSHNYRGIYDRGNGLAESMKYNVEKRSPRYSGIRGKKNPRWEIRGKFVGVRGKKWAASPYEDNSPFIRMFDNIERIGMKEDSSASIDSQ